MPHLILEYSAGAKPANALTRCFAELHDMLSREAGIRIQNCKSRAYRADNYLVGGIPEGTATDAMAGDPDFVHLEIRLLAGRSAEIKNRISGSALSVLRRYFPPDDSPGIQITVDVLDIDRQTYAKHPGGTLSTGSPT